MKKLIENEILFLNSLLFILVNIYLSKAEPSNIVGNFQMFSKELQESFTLSEPSEASETMPGVNIFNSFGIGYTLANINQQLWNVSTQGIPEALRTIHKYIPEDYSYLLGLLKKSKFKTTSTIYSRYGNVTKSSPTLSKLLSHLISLDFVSKPAEFVDSFSSMLDISTKGHLDNELLPKGLWKKVFDNQTHGAYVNTLYYKTKHMNPWMNIGERSFNHDSIVPFLEVQGEFPVFQSENMTVVIVDIQSAPTQQQLILAKCQFYMPNPILESTIRGILASNETWTSKKLRVQIPALNATNLSRHNLGFLLMRVNETFCSVNGTENSNSPPDFVQQPITQANHIEFAPGYIEFASATASTVNLNGDDSDADFEDEYDDDRSILVHEHETLEEDDVGDSLFMRTKGRFRKAMNEILGKEDGKCKDPEETGNGINSQSVLQQKGGNSGKEIEETTLIFDTPFKFILRDKSFGEVFSGSVVSMCLYKKQLQAIQSSPPHAWLQDIFKVAFWKCY